MIDVAQGGESMQRWEYKTVNLTKPSKGLEDLNRAGDDGWEAVAMVSTWGSGWSFVHPIVLLKRLLPEIADSNRRFDLAEPRPMR
jgi:hypothetical protein